MVLIYSNKREAVLVPRELRNRENQGGVSVMVRSEAMFAIRAVEKGEKQRKGGGGYVNMKSDDVIATEEKQKGGGLLCSFK